MHRVNRVKYCGPTVLWTELVLTQDFFQLSFFGHTSFSKATLMVLTQSESNYFISFIVGLIEFSRYTNRFLRFLQEKDAYDLSRSLQIKTGLFQDLFPNNQNKNH